MAFIKISPIGVASVMTVTNSEVIMRVSKKNVSDHVTAFVIVVKVIYKSRRQVCPTKSLPNEW